MIKYYINLDETRYLWKDPEFKERFDITISLRDEKAYLEILDTLQNSFLVVLHKTGERGYLPKITYNPIYIEDKYLDLYDGRFNILS